jgi:hypothetical protein
VRVKETDESVVVTPLRTADASGAVVGVLVAVPNIGDGDGVEVAVNVSVGVIVAVAAGVPVPVEEIVFIAKAAEDDGVGMAVGLPSVAGGAARV